MKASDKSSSILEQWEAEAEKAGDPSDYLGMDVFWRERFFALIDLVRKKDEALQKSCSCWASKEDQNLLVKAGHRIVGKCNSCEALALTEELK